MAPDVTASATPRCRVLVVDDDSDFAALVAHGLRHHRHEVTTVRKLAAARRALENKPFDLLILDGLLPDGNGIDFVVELRHTDNPVEVVFLSSFFRDPQNRRRLTEYGVRHLIDKTSFGAMQLIEQLDQIARVCPRAA